MKRNEIIDTTGKWENQWKWAELAYHIRREDHAPTAVILRFCRHVSMFQQRFVHGSPIVAPTYSIYRDDFSRLGCVVHDHCYCRWIKRIEEEREKKTNKDTVNERVVKRLKWTNNKIEKIFKSLASSHSLTALSTNWYCTSPWFQWKWENLP